MIMLRRLRQIRRRWRLRIFLHALAFLLALLASASAAMLLGARLNLPFLTEPRWPVLALAAVLALPLAVLQAWRRTPDLQATARRADLHFGLDERLSTSLENAGQEPAGPLATALRRALRADAEAAAQKLVPARFAPLKLPAGLGWWLACSLLAVALLQLRQGGEYLLLPAPAATTAPGVTGAGPATGGEAARDAALEAAQQQLLARMLEQAPSEEAEQAGSVQTAGSSQGREQTAAPAGQAAGPEGQLTEGEPETATAEAARPADATPGEGTDRPAAEAATRPDAGPGRNDGSTNPAYDQAAARDQELREQARRQQERAGNPGGGGDQAALADSSVAGDAAAGEGSNAAAVLPAMTETALELELPGQVNAAGERISIELPPEADETAVTETTLERVSWSRLPESALVREQVRPAERALLQRYHAPAQEHP
jgi:hypothetical protein